MRTAPAGAGTNLRRSAALLSILALALFYAAVAFVLLEPDATHSVDSTVKVIQARTLLENRFMRSGIENRGAFIDPDGQFLPLTSPYVFRSDAGWQSIFPTASALVIAPFSPWGLAGATVPALAGACLLLWLAWRFGRGGPGEPFIPAVLGLATILWFYGTSPNEHGLAAALTTAALLAALGGEGARSVVAAGLLLGLAGTLRDESLLVAPGLVVARVLAGRRAPAALARDTVGMGAASLVPLLAIAALDAFAYHRPVSAHLLHALTFLQGWLPADAVRGLPALPIIPWEDRPDVLVHQWLLGLGTWKENGVAVLAVLAAIGAWRWTKSAVPLVAVVGTLAAWRVADVAALTQATKFVGGLYRLCPFLVFAVVPLPRGLSSRTKRLALATAACYLVLALPGLNTIGGKSFGPRLLFPLLPILTVAAVQTIAAWLGRWRESRVDGLLGAIGVVLVITSAAMQLAVALPAWTKRNHSDYSTIAAVGASRDRILVVDHPSAVQMVTPYYFDRVVFLAPNQPAAAALAARLANGRVSSFTVVSRGQETAIDFAPFVRDLEVQEGRLVRQHWRR